MNYVLYHSNCYDGFGAAYAAWRCLGDSAKYIPVSYGKPPPEMPGAKCIYIVDFSYDKEVILKLAETSRVVVLDHHKTAEAKLAPLIGLDNPEVIFDMHRSGALITWEYFFGFENVPRLIEHISDRDLWTFKMQGSREVHAALVSLPFDFKVWEGLEVKDLIKEGAACLRFQSQLVDNIIKKSWHDQIGEHIVPIVNTASSWSEVGEALLKKYPEAPFAASFTEFQDITMWSLRSEDSRLDVSEVANKFGGGGHRNAAGFQVNKK